MCLRKKDHAVKPKSLQEDVNINILNETIYSDINVLVANVHKRDNRWHRIRTSSITI